MKYLIVGCGGTGGPVAAYLARAGKDVTVIARGKHLEAIRDGGLKVFRQTDDFTVKNLKAEEMDTYTDCPDVVIVCVKGYSLKDTIPFLQRVCDAHTIVIPILNIYGTGGKLQKRLSGPLVTDGCIYVAAQIKEPGCIQMNGDILRVVFGVRHPEEYRPELKNIEKELIESDIKGILTDNIQRDALLKFSYVSAQGACGLYHQVPAGEIQKSGEIRDCFAQLVHEIDLLAGAMGITFQEDIVQRNLKILDDLIPSATTSMQRDVAAGGKSEIDGLIYEVIRLGEKYQVDLPMYTRIAKALKERGLA